MFFIIFLSVLSCAKLDFSVLRKGLDFEDRENLLSMAHLYSIEGDEVSKYYFGINKDRLVKLINSYGPIGEGENRRVERSILGYKNSEGSNALMVLSDRMVGDRKECESLINLALDRMREEIDFVFGEKVKNILPEGDEVKLCDAKRHEMISDGHGQNPAITSWYSNFFQKWDEEIVKTSYGDLFQLIERFNSLNIGSRNVNISMLEKCYHAVWRRYVKIYEETVPSALIGHLEQLVDFPKDAIEGFKTKGKRILRAIGRKFGYESMKEILMRHVSMPDPATGLSAISFLAFLDRGNDIPSIEFFELEMLEGSVDRYSNSFSNLAVLAGNLFWVEHIAEKRPHILRYENEAQKNSMMLAIETHMHEALKKILNTVPSLATKELSHLARECLLLSAKCNNDYACRALLQRGARVRGTVRIFFDKAADIGLSLIGKALDYSITYGAYGAGAIPIAMNSTMNTIGTSLVKNVQTLMTNSVARIDLSAPRREIFERQINARYEFSLLISLVKIYLEGDEEHLKSLDTTLEEMSDRLSYLSKIKEKYVEAKLKRDVLEESKVEKLDKILVKVGPGRKAKQWFTKLKKCFSNPKNSAVLNDFSQVMCDFSEDGAMDALLYFESFLRYYS